MADNPDGQGDQDPAANPQRQEAAGAGVAGNQGNVVANDEANGDRDGDLLLDPPEDFPPLHADEEIVTLEQEENNYAELDMDPNRPLSVFCTLLDDMIPELVEEFLSNQRDRRHITQSVYRTIRDAYIRLGATSLESVKDLRIKELVTTSPLLRISLVTKVATDAKCALFNVLPDTADYFQTKRTTVRKIFSRQKNHIIDRMIDEVNPVAYDELFEYQCAAVNALYKDVAYTALYRALKLTNYLDQNEGRTEEAMEWYTRERDACQIRSDTYQEHLERMAEYVETNHPGLYVPLLLFESVVPDPLGPALDVMTGVPDYTPQSVRATQMIRRAQTRRRDLEEQADREAQESYPDLGLDDRTLMSNIDRARTRSAPGGPTLPEDSSLPRRPHSTPAHIADGGDGTPPGPEEPQDPPDLAGLSLVSAEGLNSYIVQNERWRQQQQKVQEDMLSALTQSIKTQVDQNKHQPSRVDLLPFDGSDEAWPLFWEHFQASVHKNTRMTVYDKLDKLMKALTGPAFDAVSHFGFDTENYELIVAKLKQQFGDPINKILNLERAIQKFGLLKDDLATLSKYSSMIAEYRRRTVKEFGELLGYGKVNFALITQNCHSKLLEQWQLTLVRAVEAKRNLIDNGLIRPDPADPDCERIKLTDKEKVDKFIHFLDDYVARMRDRDRMNPGLAKSKDKDTSTSGAAKSQSKPAGKAKPKPDSQKSSDSKPPPKAGGSGDKKSSDKDKKRGGGPRSGRGPKPSLYNFATLGDAKTARREQQSNSPKGRDPDECCFCKGNHPPRSCKAKIPSPDIAAEKVMKAKLCLGCLKLGHVAKQCPNAVKCGRDGCMRNHHPFLHGQTRLTSSSQQ